MAAFARPFLPSLVTRVPSSHMSDSVTSLQAMYGHGEAVRFAAGANELPTAILALQNGARAQVYLHGAHVTSFVIGGKDLLFMSSKAKMDASSAFRGGIPVIFPQFGPGELPQHGFSRNSNEWVVDATTATEMEASITLRLDDNEATRSIWPHRFSLNDADPFHFTTALHSYFAVENVEQVAVSPLAGLTYKDKVKNGEKFNEKDEMVKIVGEVDRLYEKAPFSLTINEGGKPLISVVKEGFSDVVVWNIGKEKGPKMADLGEGEWKRYVCVEAGQIADPVSLPAGHAWTAKQTIATAHDAARL